MNVPLLVMDFLSRARTLYPHAVGAVCGSHRLTYDQLGIRIDRFSAALTRLGVRKGDVVAFLSPNCHRLLEAYYAVPQLGAILLPLNTRLTADDIEFILADARAHSIVVDRGLAELFTPIRDRLPQLKCVVFTGAGATPHVGDLDYENLIEKSPSEPPPVDLAEDDPAELFYTSGTTGRPKGVILTHRNLYLHAFYSLAGLGGYDDSCIQLHSIPLFHVNGWGTPHFVTMLGGRHVFVPRFDPELVLTTIERERVTHVFLVPTMATALLAAPSFSTADLSSLRRIKLGGAAAPASLVAALSERLPNCHVEAGYGLTETSPIVSVAYLKAGSTADSQSSIQLRATAGLPVPGVRVEILDDAGHLVPHDGHTHGEVCVRSNTVSAGYWNLPEESSQAIRGGWFHTGDIGTIDAQGYIAIVDRKKDIIVTGGENVATLEIENAICDHAAVLECAVIALPDPYWGEVPAAVVVCKPRHGVDATSLIEHCRANLAGFKVPKAIFFVDALPKGGTGKVLKRELRDRYCRGAAPSSPTPGVRP